MAAAEMLVRTSPAGVVQALGGMGILRMLRWWPADQAAAGGRADAWPAAPALPAQDPGALALVAWPEPTFDRRAAALALARTLADWRAAERKLDRMVMDSLDWTRTQAEVAGLRATHHRLFGELSRHVARS